MFLGTKIFTAYSKPELVEPSARVELVREGFSFWAFLFTILWLLSEKLWVASLVYLLIEAAIICAGVQFGLSQITLGLLQAFVQLMLGFSAYDIKRASLGWRGYKLSGVVAAETALNAERRYYDHVA